MKDIDDLDSRIVTLLQQNARVTNAEVSKQVGVSEATVRRRIEKLLDQDVIRIQAVADPFKLGYAMIVIIGLWVDKGHLENAEKYVCSLPEVRFVGMTMGSYDIMMEVWFRSRQELVQFVTHTLAAVPGIGRSEAFEVIKLSKYAYDWGRPS